MENEVKSSKQNHHKAFKNNPKYFKSLLNKTVEIITVDGKTHKGTVYVVDPVSESVVTITYSKDKCDVNIFMGHAIKSLQVVDNEKETKHEFKPNTTTTPLNEALIGEKKKKLVAWLKKNLIDVEEEDLNLKVGEDLIIEPPYDITHCFCSNTIILQRIQDIIGKMPNTNN